MFSYEYICGKLGSTPVCHHPTQNHPLYIYVCIFPLPFIASLLLYLIA